MMPSSWKKLKGYVHTSNEAEPKGSTEPSVPELTYPFFHDSGRENNK